MTERETSQAIDAAAAAWVAREDRGSWSSEDRMALEAWLTQDTRRPGAYLRARAVSMKSLSARALGAQYDPADFGAPAPEASSPSRRRMLAWGGAALASAAGMTVAAAGFLQAPRAHATARGEIRLVPLADGSTMMLNTETTVRVKYDDDRRFVRLVEGEADFTVLVDTARPFVVEAGGRRLRATGGVFRVRRLKNGPVDVLVRHGRVELSRAGALPDAPGQALEANTRFVAPSDPAAVETPVAPRPVSQDEVARELAWRDGKIAFEGETLSEAAAAFARYSDTRIVITDAALAREPVVGLFAANDPRGFGMAVAGVFGATAQAGDGAVMLSRPSADQAPGQ